ncbi:MAG TPA: hypothetical protein DEP69_02325 [Acidimicrobiaceae bacterium]|nr:hypothetical protein [Acidimicrobiaceae bacterium]
MGECRHCGKDAGFLRRRHAACEDSFDTGVTRVAALVADADSRSGGGGAGTAAADSGTAAAAIENIAAEHRVRGDDLSDAVAAGWRRAMAAALDAGGLSPEHQAHLDALLRHFRVSRADADRDGLTERVERQRLLRARGDIAALVSEAVAAVTASADGADGADGAAGAAPSPHTARIIGRITARITDRAAELGIAGRALSDLLVACLEAEIERALADELLTEAEERAVLSVAEQFDIDDFADSEIHTRLVKAAVLRELSEGRMPTRLNLTGHPFRLMKSETLLWAFPNVDYYTVKVSREFRGRSRGVSFRVARGVYLRTGNFRGKPVKTEQVLKVDTGLLGITTKHIYFAGARKRFRVRHDRIVTIEAYTDGVGIMRDSARAQPETFVLGDGWFAYNLLQSIEVD